MIEILNFFKYLNECNIEYCILENKFDDLNKSEIDIVISKKSHIKKISKKFNYIITEHGYMFILFRKSLNKIIFIHINGFISIKSTKIINRFKFIVGDRKKFKFKNKSKIKHIYFLLNRFIYGSGIIVSLLGPDGSGKSTVGKNLKLKLSKYYKVKYFYNGNLFKYNIFLITSLINLLIYHIRYLYFLSLKKLGYIVILDRYTYSNTHSKHNKLIQKLNYLFFYKLFYTPDIFFLLTVSPKICFKRKHELSVDKIKKYYTNYNKLLNKKVSYNINNEQKIDLTISEINTKLLKKYFLNLYYKK